MAEVHVIILGRGVDVALNPGDVIGPYCVVGQIGQGGMGEVYRATDTKLQREVALKVLPASFTHDAARVARFTREAQVLASLNHPNIGGIYGLEDAHGSTALVLELVEGPTLSDLLAGSKPLPSHAPSTSRGRLQPPSKRRTSGQSFIEIEARQHQGASGRHGEGARLRPGEGAR